MSSATVEKPIRKIAKPATRTTLAKVGQVENAWVVVDATDQTLGRLASKVAMRLMGKHKPTYTTSVDVGDHVVVLNTTKIKVTGKKLDQRQYEYYTYYPGGKGVASLKDLHARHPNKVFEMAVRRMLPKTRMGLAMFKKLHCYADANHAHAAQRPQAVSL